MYEISFDISQSKFSKIMEISFAKLVLTYDITLEMIMTLKFFFHIRLFYYIIPLHRRMRQHVPTHIAENVVDFYLAFSSVKI